MEKRPNPHVDPPHLRTPEAFRAALRAIPACESCRNLWRAEDWNPTRDGHAICRAFSCDACADLLLDFGEAPQ